MDRVDILYDRSPINAERILRDLGRQGRYPDRLRPQDLFAYDQDHYGGIEAVDALARRAGIGRDDLVLDVCSGLGGPARYLAWRFGCRVVGIDLTGSRCAGAGTLSRAVGLAARTRFVTGDAVRLPFAGGSFAAVVSQESFFHVSDAGALLAGCGRVLAPGGRLAFTDWIAMPTLSADERHRMEESFAAHGLRSVESYLAALRAAGFPDPAVEDLSAAWQPILRDRSEMNRRHREEVAQRHGEALAERWLRDYAGFVELVQRGKIGGARFCATSCGKLAA